MAQYLLRALADGKSKSAQPSLTTCFRWVDAPCIDAFMLSPTYRAGELRRVAANAVSEAAPTACPKPRLVPAFRASVACRAQKKRALAKKVVGC
ncbi:MAG: hypothetical protein JWN48_2141 [Myxococcaceae bacterium]|nr:hypothetical protein [Myxococcaceae bacterium]